MNKLFKLFISVIVTTTFVLIVGLLGYSLTYKYKFLLENAFNNAQKEINSYIDYYLNFIFET